ncbi:hypothetical protein B0J13DRAFT_107462 [Dactylonectria estremocensis]|uniref:Bacteriophage T5 Orf172 DNA-binding domain-containing protein n=1 Tax=Dactylonectria estremocensis TaxID=1079267 RepID=A0A9P9IQQ2_9HYPO|nr:hypothetical protein B0J13DRAFT_107462 [Dactylonectria estremocensis]
MVEYRDLASSPLFRDGVHISATDTPTKFKKRRRTLGSESSPIAPPSQNSSPVGGQHHQSPAQLKPQNTKRYSESVLLESDVEDTSTVSQPSFLQTETNDKHADSIPDDEPSLLNTPPPTRKNRETTPVTSPLFADIRSPGEEAAATPSPARSRSGTPSKSVPITLSSQIDDRIVECLKKPLKNKKALEIGGNYIFRVILNENDCREIVKIGKTKRTRSTRAQGIQYKCQHDKIEPAHDAEYQNIARCKMIEKLSQEELLPFQHKFKCNCGVDHQEYFNVTPEVALEVVQRWRCFCQKLPWGADEKLTPFWEKRLDTMAQCGENETIHDYEARAKRWKKFASPSRLEYFIHDVHDWYSKLSPWWWQIATFVNSLCLVVSTWNTQFSPMAVFNVAIIACLIATPQLGLTTPVIFIAGWRRYDPISTTPRSTPRRTKLGKKRALGKVSVEVGKVDESGNAHIGGTSRWGFIGRA